MKHDSRLSSVLHALLHMADAGRVMTSEELAKCMCTNPVVVRRTLGLLRDAGFVTAFKGPSGGWALGKPLETITLRQLHEALGEPAIFAIGNRNERPTCLVEQSVNAVLNDAFDAAEALLMERFGAITLAALARDFSGRAAAFRSKRDEKHVHDT